MAIEPHRKRNAPALTVRAASNTNRHMWLMATPPVSNPLPLFYLCLYKVHVHVDVRLITIATDTIATHTHVCHNNIIMYNVSTIM